MTRKDSQKLAGIRLKEAETLLAHGHFEGCYYLSGYVVEFALKACIAKMTKRHDFPDKELAYDVFTHDLTKLLKLAKLSSAYDKLDMDSTFRLNWLVVKGWREQCRYETPTMQEAHEMYQAVANRKYGVLRWIKRYW